MIIPVRCFSCNKVIGNLEEAYNNLRKNQIEGEEIFKKLGITRICCKRMLTTYADLSDKKNNYKNSKISIITNNNEKKYVQGI